MPQRRLQRTWCNTCKEFELFERAFEKDSPLLCGSCGNEFEEFLLKDIPKEKAVEQRKKYKSKRISEMNSVFGKYMLHGLDNIGPNSFNDSVGENTHIIEDDAGQREIEKIEKIERDKIILERKIQRQKDLALKDRYRNVGRNDVCLCGSEKKYKKCCWNKIYKI